MKPNIVVDVGNSRIKWGRCADDVVAEAVSLPRDETGVWDKRVQAWGLSGPQAWCVSGVDPEKRDFMVKWVRARGDTVVLLEDYQQLNLSVQVDNPETVGMDRLLNAVAARERVHRPIPVIIIDAGTAVTVDLVDEERIFLGGAILPGFRLMAKALNDYTALLPLVEITSKNPYLPGDSTESAIKGGIYWAVAGGIQALVRQLTGTSRECEVFLTGGDAGLLAPVMDLGVTIWQEMTLEGIRVSAEALP